MTRRLFVALSLLLLGLTIGSGVSAQDADIVVGEIKIPVLRWGPQKVVVDITNNADYYKIVSVVTGISFEGVYLDPSRSDRTNYFVEPSTTVTLEPEIVIPGNYGKASIEVQVYDVVDTLDELLSYQLMAKQPFTINYSLPEALVSYFQEEVTFPPMVSNSPDFETEFSRIAILLAREGKTLQEIADLTECDLAHVKHFMENMVERRYATRVGEDYRVLMPVITAAEATEARVIAEETADALVELVRTNLPAYEAKLKSMAAEGLIEATPDDFMHGGSVLYYTWPTVAGLFFWYDLGQDFIAPGTILSVFRGTDFCNAKIPLYMYAVQGGPYFNGTGFYTLELAPGNMDVIFMDSIPDVGCIAGFEKYKKLFPGMQWAYEEGVEIEPFVLDTLLANTALSSLKSGAHDILARATAGLTDVVTKYGNEELRVGHRYWFWNLTVSRALIKLDESGVVKRWGNGRYRFEELSHGMK